MGGIGEAIGIFSSLASGIGGLMGGFAAGDAAGSMGDAAAAQMAMAKAMWDRYMAAFAPLEDKLIAESQTPARELEGFREAKGAMNRSYADLGANADNVNATMYPGGGGMVQARNDALERSRIKGIANLESDWDQNRWNRMMGIAGYGRNLPATALSGYSSAGSMYGNLANMYGNAMNQGMSGFGSALGGVNWGNMFGGSGGGQILPGSMYEDAGNWLAGGGY